MICRLSTKIYLIIFSCLNIWFVNVCQAIHTYYELVDNFSQNLAVEPYQEYLITLNKKPDETFICRYAVNQQGVFIYILTPQLKLCLTHEMIISGKEIEYQLKISSFTSTPNKVHLECFKSQPITNHESSDILLSNTSSFDENSYAMEWNLLSQHHQFLLSTWQYYYHHYLEFSARPHPNTVILATLLTELQKNIGTYGEKLHTLWLKRRAEKERKN